MLFLQIYQFVFHIVYLIGKHISKSDLDLDLNNLSEKKTPRYIPKCPVWSEFKKNKKTPKTLAVSYEENAVEGRLSESKELKPFEINYWYLQVSQKDFVFIENLLYGRPKTNFKQAEFECSKRGGKLATFDNLSLYQDIVSRIYENYGEGNPDLRIEKRNSSINTNLYLWIGLNSTIEGKWLWTNGTEPNFSFFNENEINEKNTSLCIRVSYDAPYYWIKSNCEKDKASFICQDIKCANNDPENILKNCEEIPTRNNSNDEIRDSYMGGKLITNLISYEQIDTPQIFGNYSIFRRKARWETAKNICESKNMKLAVFENINEFQNLTFYMTKNFAITNISFWIGIIQNEDNFEGSDDKNYTFPKWNEFWKNYDDSKMMNVSELLFGSEPMCNENCDCLSMSNFYYEKIYTFSLFSTITNGYQIYSRDCINEDLSFICKI